MRYLIDGYNLLHATGHLLGPVGPGDLERARRALLEQLHRSYGEAAACVTVVFDARRAPRRVPAELDHRGVRVINALDGEADDIIEEMIRRESAPHLLTVVSDDHRLREAAQRRRCVVAACLDFFELLLQPAPPPPAVDGPVKPTELPPEVNAELEQVFRLPPDLDDPPFPLRRL